MSIDRRPPHEDTALDVYLEAFAEPVGAITTDDSGAPQFTYRAAYLARPDTTPLSLALPLMAAPFPPLATSAFFANLLPEGEALQQMVAPRGIDVTDLVQVLAYAGAECAGAVSVVPSGAPAPKRPGVVPADYVRQSDDELSATIAALAEGRAVSDPLRKISLAGAQRKTALYIDEQGTPFRAKPGAPTTHIIKVGHHPLDDLVENELFCLEIARALGLDVCHAQLRRAGVHPYLAIVRYDRALSNRDNERIISRLHQEDFAQALGLFPPSRKYTEHGGPPAEALFALPAAVPAVFRRDLLRALIVAFLLGNSDAHAKNFSLMHQARGATLAPLYDLLCMKLYPAYDQGLALSVGGEREYPALDRRAWHRFARDSGMRPQLVERELLSLASRIVPAAQERAHQLLLSPRVTQKIIGAIGEQVEHLNQAFAWTIPVDVPPLVTSAPGWPRFS